MNLEKLTHKSQEALQEAQSIALRHSHSEVSPERLMLVLLDQEGGVLPRTLQRMAVNIPEIRGDLEGALSKLPRVSGLRLRAVHDTLPADAPGAGGSRS
jgi:ATP-dependent Clp protease ATP-binding subunit ClpB